MVTERFDDLNNTEVEAPGGTQLTHASAEIHDPRGRLEREIREHPLRSMAIALLGGFLVAKLLD